MKPRTLPHLFSYLVQGVALRRLLQLAPAPGSARVLLIAPSGPTPDLLADLLPAAEITHQLPPGESHIPLPAHEFDVIISILPLHKRKDWRTFLAECARLMRHGGLLYVATRHNHNLTLSALRGHVMHHGFTALSQFPSGSGYISQRCARHFTLSAFRLSITQPEYD